MADANGNSSLDETMYNEVDILREEVRNQQKLIEDLKLLLGRGNGPQSDEIFHACNRIAEQESRLLKYTIKQLRDELEEKKRELQARQELYRKEKELCLSQKEKIDEGKQELEKAIERVDCLQIELDRTNRRSLSTDNEMQHTSSTINELLHAKLQDSGLIASLQSKLRFMQRSKQNLLDQLMEFKKNEEHSLMSQVERMENSFAPVQTEERGVNTDMCELYYLSVQNNYAEVLCKIEKLTSHIESSKEGRNSDTIKESELWREVGSLTTKNVQLEKELIDSKNLEQSLRMEMSEASEKIGSLNMEIRRLEQELNENTRVAEATSRYLLEENRKIKQQKAALRCDYVVLNRKHMKLLGEQFTLSDTCKDTSLDPNISTSDSKDVSSDSKCAAKAGNKENMPVDNVSADLSSGELSKSALCDKNLSPMREVPSPDLENVEPPRACSISIKTVDGTTLDTLKQQLNSALENNQELMNALRIVDAQCEKLLEMKKRLEKSRDLTVRQQKGARNQLKNANNELASKVEIEAQLKSVISERNRLRIKCEYLMEELSETHADYRVEMKLAAERCSLSSNNGDSTNMEKFTAEKRELDAALKSCQRELELRKTEIKQQTEDLLSLQESQSSIIEENAKLRTGLAKAIEKAMNYKDETENLRTFNNDLTEDLEEYKANEQKLTEQLDELKQAYDERDRLIAYLQSRTSEGVCPSRATTSKSTLISRGSSLSIVRSLSSCDRKSTLQPIVSQSCGVSLTKFDRRAESVSSSGHGGVEKFSMPSNLSEYAEKVCSSATQEQTFLQMGTMKHDIPHRWENFFNIKQIKCAACFEGLPRFRLGLKCKDCGITAHRGCSLTIANTCGLPVQCADYYLGALQAVNDVMSGHLEIWRSDSLWENRWLSVLATLDGEMLMFFEIPDHSAPSASGKLVLSIDLSKEKWRIHMQAVPESKFNGGMSSENRSLLLELRLQRYNLFILAPSMQAKQRWLQGLQSATNKQMLSQHRSVPSHNENVLLFALDAPLNLTVCCAKVVVDWILIGAREGFFVANLSRKDVPRVVTGLSSVHEMELIEDLDMLAAISGQHRQLVFIHMADIRAIFNSECTTVRSTPLSHLTSCHLMTVYSNSAERIQYLLVADAEKIEILQFNSRFNIFTQFNSVKTTEPVSCLLSVSGGLIFGADQFYFMDIKNFDVRPFTLPDTREDWPRAAISIANNEFLLAFHNFGIFVDIDGRKTRADLIEWKRSPMEFVCAAPFMYVVHLETLEILRVAPNEGTNSSAFSDDREVFRCKNAHFIGRGRHASEVIFVLSSAERTEIHLFSNVPEKKAILSLKRKETKFHGESSQSYGTVGKRAKI